MAVLASTDAFVSINSVDLSDHIKKVTLDFKAELQDTTAMGNTTRQRIPGLLNWNLVVEAEQDYAASKVDATMFPLIGAAAFPIDVRPVKTGGRSATNPSYTGNGVLGDYKPLDASIGALVLAPVTIESAGALSRQIV